MSITRRIVLLLVLIFAVYVIVMYGVMRLSVLPAFSQLDRDLAALNQSRVEQYLQATGTRLMLYTADEALWDDIHFYMLGRYPSFREKTLPLYAGELRENTFYLILNLDQTENFLATNIQSSVSEQAFREFLPELLRDQAELFQFEDLSQVEDPFYVRGNDVLLMLSAYPIMSSKFEGPVAGTLVHGIVLDDNYFETMGRALDLNVKIWDIESQQAQSILGPNAFSSALDMVVPVENESTLHQYRVFSDPQGNPAFMTEVYTSRGLLKFGEDTLSSVTLLLVIMLVFVTITLWLILDRNVIKHVRQLQQHIDSIDDDGDLGRQIEYVNSDEIGDVAEAFNALSSSLQSSREESEAARQEALAAAASKSRFLANMSHEIRTPMNGIMGLLYLLRTSPHRQDQFHYLQLANSSGESLMEILNDILDVAKIDTHEIRLESVEFDLHQLIEDVLELLAGASSAEGLELGSMIDKDIPVRIKGDPNRIRQILTNLISNALKFTIEGEVLVRVEQREEGVLQFTVADTGIGIEPTVQAKVFERFAQADESTTREYGGTGLGLSLCKRLVELMGGMIGVNSTPGAGSAFWFTVNNQAKPGTKDGQKLIRIPETNRILVVSDNNTSKKLLEFYFLLWSKVELKIVSDISSLSHTPGLDEVEVAIIESMDLQHATERLEEVKAALSQGVRLLAISSHDQMANQSAFKDAGYNAVVIKPLSYQKLARVIGKQKQIPAVAGQHDRVAAMQVDELNRHRILLVEDNIVNQKVAASMLKKLGCQVDIAENGQVACEVLAKSKYDLVFMDCHMPVLGGIDATRKIRARERANGLPSQPIVAMTADCREENTKASLAAGMNGHIAKPINVRALAKALSDWA